MKFLDHIANPRRLSCPIWKLIAKEVKTLCFKLKVIIDLLKT